MFLSKLLENIVQIPPNHDRPINGISSDSRQVNAGDLFIAYMGKPETTAQYIEQAITRGAAAVLYPATLSNAKIQQFNSTLPLIPVQQLENLAGEIAAQFYHHPSRNMRTVGITGTNGKTSCSQFIARAIQLSGQSCGIIGTLGNGFPDRLIPGVFTTPDALALQKLLADLKQQGAQAISMEVSSHGLAQNRVAGVNFDIAVFTNLTRDHLDYHGSMENYAAAKRRLFTWPELKYAVINAQDNYGKQWIAEFSDKLPVYAYSTEPMTISDVPMIYASKVQCHDQGFKASLHTPWGEGELRSGLLGRFNLSNLLAALTVLGLMNIPLQEALRYLAQMPTVPGRMQRFGGADKPLVVVDYSHTPDSLEKALLALREHCQGKLWCVFGCGGNRDRGKRPMMGRIAQQYSDHFIITDDNPRHEDPELITREISMGITNPQSIKIIHNRKEAIAWAIACANPGDAVLIAGKGHEIYQQVGDVKLPFSDAEQVQGFLKLSL